MPSFYLFCSLMIHYLDQTPLLVIYPTLCATFEYSKMTSEVFFLQWINFATMLKVGFVTLILHARTVIFIYTYSHKPSSVSLILFVLTHHFSASNLRRKKIVVKNFPGQLLSPLWSFWNGESWMSPNFRKTNWIA